MKTIFQKLLILCILFGSGLLTSTVLAQDENSSLTDAEIASIAVVANQIDIDFAEIAKERSTDEEVLWLARTMATDHQMVIDRAVDLVTRLGVTPEDNAVSQSLNEEARATRERLRNLPQEEFDEEYVENEVAYHEKVIAAVEGLLIPQAENKELKALLEEVLPVLEGHLEHARMIGKNH